MHVHRVTACMHVHALYNIQYQCCITNLAAFLYDDRSELTVISHQDHLLGSKHDIGTMHSGSVVYIQGDTSCTYKTEPTSKFQFLWQRSPSGYLHPNNTILFMYNYIITYNTNMHPPFNTSIVQRSIKIYIIARWYIYRYK